MRQYWQRLSITRKFSVTFSLLIFLILLVSMISYGSLAIVRYQLDTRILASTDIEVLVLEINQKLDQARRMERDFFLRYPEIGLTEAHEQYAQPAVKKIAELIPLSEELKQRLAESNVSQVLQDNNVNLNLFLSSAKRNGEVFLEGVALVTSLAAEDVGAITRLNQTSHELRQKLLALNDKAALDLYRDMLDEEKQYLLTRRRPHLQLVFNLADDLTQVIQAHHLTKAASSQEAMTLLTNYRAQAEEVALLDVAIRGKFKDFDLQATAVEPISAKLLELAKAEVLESRAQTENISQLATFLVIVIALMGLTIALGVVYVLNSSVTKNIINLTRVANQLQVGNFEVKAVVDSQDELGQLAHAFNEMSAQINHLVDNLEQQVQQRTRRLEVSASLSEQLNALLDFNQLLVALVNQIKLNFNYYHVHIYLLDFDSQYLVMSEGTGEAGREMKRQGHEIALTAPASLVAQAARQAQIVSVVNVREVANWLANPLLPDTYAEMAVPIIREGQVVGVLDVQSDKIAGLDEGDANLLRSLAGQVAVAMSNARLFAQNQAALQETKTLYTISQRMLMANNLTELITAVVEEARIAVINRVVLFTFEYNEVGYMVAITSQANWSSGQGMPPTPIGTRYLRTEVPILNLFVTEIPVMFDDVFHDETLDAPTLAVGKRLNIQTMAVLPLWSQGQQLGVLLLEGEVPHAFSEAEIRPYQAMLGQLSVVVENQQLLQQTIQAKEEAEQARARADTANQAKSDFLSRMSHELRTPLNGILGYAQILKNEANLSRKQVDGLGVIQQSGEHLLTLITDILDLAKIEAGRFELLPVPIQLDNFMKNTLAIIQMRAEKKRLELSYQSLSMIPEAVAVDEKRLRQVLLNLLNNAIKFTESGQIILQLEKIAPSDINQVRLRFAVIDTGIGMTPAQLQHIFNPFEQVGDMKKRAEGTGLGLAISKQLVEAMGGQLQVTSEFNQGSTFWFELLLPLANLTLTQTPLTQERIVGYEGERRKILVVDDKVNNRMVFLNILEPLGFEVAMAEDGQEAIDQSQSWRPDLILMDMIMPNVTGFEATQTIRNISALKMIAIIGTSASAFETEAERVKLAGCDAFISKPVHVEELILLIGELLNLHWRYQQPVLETVSSVAKNQTQLACPPTELLSQWHELAMMGDLLTIEDEAQQLAETEERYKPFVEQLTALTTKLNMNKVMSFLDPYLLS